LPSSRSSALVHGSVRRLAWFVPPLLAAAVESDDFAGPLRKLAALAVEARAEERARRGDGARDFTVEERRALIDFLLAATADRAASSVLAADDVRAVVHLAVASGCDPWPVLGALIEGGRAAEAEDALTFTEAAIRRDRAGA